MAAMRARGRSPRRRGLAAAVNANRYAGGRTWRWRTRQAQAAVRKGEGTSRGSRTTRGGRRGRPRQPEARREDGRRRRGARSVRENSRRARDAGGRRRGRRRRRARGRFERCAVGGSRLRGPCAPTRRGRCSRWRRSAPRARAGAWPKTVLYNAVLDAFEAAGRCRRRGSSSTSSTRNGVPYDAVTYNIALRLCARDGAYQRAAGYWTKWSRIPPRKCGPTSFRSRRPSRPAASSRSGGGATTPRRAPGSRSGCCRAAPTPTRSRSGRRSAPASAGPTTRRRSATRPASRFGARAHARGGLPAGRPRRRRRRRDRLARLRRAARDDVGFSAGARAAEFFGLVDRRALTRRRTIIGRR